MLQQNLRSIGTRICVLVAILFSISSFSIFKGGDIFEIYINDKKIVEQFVFLDPKAVKSFSLDKSSAQDKVRVMYSHCGKIGKSRSITITNEANKALKTWKFEDNPKSGKIMDCNAADLLAMVKENSKSKLNLVYTSEEIPDGKMLATILVNKTNSAIGKLK